ncbi:MAG: hypothetical protein P8171_20130 [Candidatus Thiodiazotropha sp.]
MKAQLDEMVLAILSGRDDTFVGILSTGERCYVALATGRYDLLPGNYADPIEAWNRLDAELRTLVCRWRNWPDSYAKVGA